MKKKSGKLPGFIDGLPSRSYMIMIVAGGYLAYLGYQLFKGYLSGEAEEVIFLIAGAVFILLGLAMALTGVWGSVQNAKMKEAEEAENHTLVEADAEEELQEPVASDENMEETVQSEGNRDTENTI